MERGKGYNSYTSPKRTITQKEYDKLVELSNDLITEKKD